MGPTSNPEPTGKVGINLSQAVADLREQRSGVASALHRRHNG